MSYIPDRKVKELVEKNKIIIYPYFENFQGPNCYYCHIGENFLVPKATVKEFDPLINNIQKDFFENEIHPDYFILEPHSFVLAESFEFFGTDKLHTIRLFNSSSLARCGVGHLALGMINPGCGKEDPIKITLELFNQSPFPVKIIPTKTVGDTVVFGTEVFKVSILEMDSKPQIGYSEWKDGIFASDKGPVGSKMHLRYQKSNEFKLQDSLNNRTWKKNLS